MSQLNLNFPMDAGIKNLRQYLATGSLPTLHQKNRTKGIVCAAAGALGVAAEVFLFIMFYKYPGMTNARFPGSQIVGTILFGLLCLYGIRNLVNPESHGDYQVHYLGLQETVTRNTGYPHKPYIPEQWEIPLTVYSQEALANILKLVGGWGEDNICFICNKESHGYHSRNISYAYIFNQCEKGIFLVPIGADNGAYKAFADLTIYLPLDNIEKIYTTKEKYPRKNSIGLSIYTKDKFWDPHVKFSRTGGFIFNIDGHIDNAPFHDENVNKIYMMYRDNLRIYLQNKYNH